MDEARPSRPEDAPTPGADERLPYRVLALAVGPVLLLVALVAVALWGSVGEQPAVRRGTFQVTRPPLVAAAPDFTLPDLDGRRVALHDFRGSVVLLNFWATWCPPCREEMPALQELARDGAVRGLVVLGINHEEPPDRVAAFVREHGLAFPVLLDESGEVGRQYGVTALPVTFVVHRAGLLAGTVLGFRDWRGPPARAYLDGLLAAAR